MQANLKSRLIPVTSSLDKGYSTYNTVSPISSVQLKKQTHVLKSITGNIWDGGV